MRKTKRIVSVGILLLAAFAVWTFLIQTVDVQQIGPRQSAVGFATVNGWFHRLTNVHWMLYTLTDWLGLVPIVVCLLFAYVGLAQLVQRCFLCCFLQAHWKSFWFACKNNAAAAL